MKGPSLGYNLVINMSYSMTLVYLASLIFHECSICSIHEQYAIGHVVINRSIDQNKPVSYIVTQPHQFSHFKLRKLPISMRHKFIKIANNVLHTKDNTNGALYFHLNSIHTKWDKRMRVTIRYKYHVFMKKVK